MKFKNYFIISSVISILLSIYSMVVASETVRATIEEIKNVYKNFSQDFQDRLLGIYEKSGEKVIILFGIIVIVLSLFILSFALNKTLLKHKGLVITFSILMFVFTDRLLVQLLAISNFIIMLCSKRKNKEDFPDKTKKEIPKLELKTVDFKEKVYSIILVLVYFSQFLWSKYLPNELYTVLVIEIIFNIIMLTLCMLVFNKQLKENFLTFKQNFKVYVTFIMPKIGMAYLFLFISSLISTLITKNGVSINQENVEALPIFYMLPMAIIYAPLVEEILFRGVLRRFIKNNFIFIVVSALVFGILHTIGEASFIEVLVMALPYTTLGAYLAYIYVKTNNIFSNIASHAVFNTVSAIFMLFI